MFKTLVFGVLFFLSSAFCAAQKQVEHQQQIWYAYNNSIQFDTTWTLVSEVQERRFINPDASSQFLIRTNLHRYLGKGWDVAAGLSYFFHSPGDPKSEIELVVPEIRPDIQFNYRQKFKSWRLEHRYKIEARFFHNTNPTLTDLEKGYAYATLRFRYRLQFVLPLVKFSEAQKLSLKAGDEILLNVGKKIVKNVFDQNRWFVGLNMTFSPSFSLEVGYINWFQEQSSGVDYYNRDILRLALYQVIQ